MLETVSAARNERPLSACSRYVTAQVDGGATAGPRRGAAETSLGPVFREEATIEPMSSAPTSPAATAAGLARPGSLCGWAGLPASPAAAHGRFGC